MRTLSLCVGALLLPVALLAQSQDYASAKAAYEDLSTKLQKQNTAFRQARQEVQNSDAYKEARKARDNQAISKLMGAVQQPDVVGLAKQAIAAADKFGKDEYAVRLLGWAANNSRDKDVVREVVQRIEKDHLASPALEELLERASGLSRYLGQEEGAAFLDKVLETSPHGVVKAWVLYWKGMPMMRQDRAAAQELLDQAEKLAGDHWLGDRIRGPKFKQENLQIGMVAPDISGEDIDGVAFKLSDYRGKVVVLDFWGFW